MDGQASQALDDWTHAIHQLVAAMDARETAERLHADALTARHPFKSRIARTYARLVSAILREEVAQEAEAAARQRFGRTGALRDHPPGEQLPAPHLAEGMPVRRR